MTLKSRFRGWIIILAAILFSALQLNAQDQPWRSELYPFSWQKGYEVNGKFLHDFSFAGYHKGELALPNVQQNILNVTQAPFHADNTGANDATAAIQAAIDSVAKLGSGVVYLPEGTYAVSPVSSNALMVSHDSTIIRGAGTDKTFILNTETNMRSKTVIEFSPGNNSWYSPNGQTIDFTVDATEHDTVFHVSDASYFEVGDLVVLTSDFTNEFIEEHHMTGKWNTSVDGTAFTRRIVSIDAASNTIEVDIPIRYYLKTRDNARAYRIRHQLKECGLENLSIGMIENPKSGYGENDYNSGGTGAYEVHAAHAIKFKYSENCWMQNVNTFKPAANKGDFHVQSNALELYQSRLITVYNCILQKPQYEGGGGNGYMFTLRGNDCLITHCQAIHSRHNYDFKKAYSNGNVIYKSLSKDSKYATDFHMHLSMSNLFDNHTVDNDFLEAVYRPYGTIEHGHSSTQSVFWNTYGEQYHGNSNRIIASGQYGYGYVIGTQGNATGVSLPTGNNTEPIDHLEGEAEGASLHPSSLYQDQLNRRLHGMTAIDSTGWDAPVIQVLSPTTGEQLFAEEVSFDIAFTTSESDVARVVYTANEVVLAKVNEAPFEYTWTSLSDDCYEVTVQAFAQSGTPSNKVTFDLIIGLGCEVSYYGAPFNLPGKIEAEYFNKGRNGLSYFDTDQTNNGGDYRPNEPVDVQSCSEGGYNVGWIADEEFLKYIVNVEESGNYTLSFRTASEESGNIHFNFLQQQVSGDVEVPTTAGWQDWATQESTSFYLKAGTDTLKLSFGGGFNLNYMELTEYTVLNTQDNDLSLYPNPVFDQLTVNAQGYERITVVDMLGRVVLIHNLKESNSVDVRHLRKGLYIVKASNEAGSKSWKLVKK
ncbi:carbohydrate-binding protein [Marinoscillum sp.]|uniref:carbohydrate-binding protein n=1 Tax=Marinoscillum sp. TaxID=2024838 RepID=UPI003BA89634